MHIASTFVACYIAADVRTTTARRKVLLWPLQLLHQERNFPPWSSSRSALEFLEKGSGKDWAFHPTFESKHRPTAGWLVLSTIDGFWPYWKEMTTAVSWLWIAIHPTNRKTTSRLQTTVATPTCWSSQVDALPLFSQWTSASTSPSRSPWEPAGRRGCVKTEHSLRQET